MAIKKWGDIVGSGYSKTVLAALLEHFQVSSGDEEHREENYRSQESACERKKL